MLFLILSLLVDPSTYVGNVYGRVFAKDAPVAGATVLILDNGIPVCSTSTAADGTYLINSIPTPFDGKRYSIDIGGVRVDDVIVLPGATMALEVNADLERRAATWHYRHERDLQAVPSPRIRGDNFTRTIFATREGLVGGTTSNGHVIVENDHFVALPSRRALSTNFGHEREVRISFGGRTAVMPVWDVGPWNTTDDYWNPNVIRERFKDLPRGKPESEAAFLEGYNGGLDSRGRVVRNPAGIDLADGTFRQDLALPDNSWIEVEYLWLDSRGPTIAAADPPTTFTNTVSIDVQVSDESPIEAVEYFIDDQGPFPAVASDGAFDSATESVRLNLVVTKNATVTIRARDVYGNTSESATVGVTTGKPSPKRRATSH